jgi:hypothetical protein
MNVIRSYLQEESEITLAASRRLGHNEPGEGCLVPVHMRAGRCPITEGPIRAWTVETIGELEPGDSPDGSGQNPVAEGADMMIGVWDWGRVNEHLRYGWRSAEVLAPPKGGPRLKWHLTARRVNGEMMHLDVCKGAGIVQSEITHAAAAMAGFPHYYTYRVQVEGTREESDFRAKGVDFIRHMSAKGTGGGELPSWERPDVLLGVKDAKRLEGYLRTGWSEGRVTPGGLPKRNRTASARREEELASNRAKAAAKGVVKRAKVRPQQAAGVLKVQKYADDTTVRLQRALRSNQPEAGERGPGKKKNKWTYIQTIRTGTGGAGTGLKVMFDSYAQHTLILHTAAARAALTPDKQKKWVMSPDSGKMEESSCGYSVPLMDCRGNVHFLKARGVDYTIYSNQREVPPTASAVFTEMQGSASHAHQAAGMVDLIIGQGYGMWHPQKVCDSWQTEDNLTLMRSEFPPRWMVRETVPTERKA